MPEHNPAQTWRTAVDAYQRGDAARAVTLAEQQLALGPPRFELLHLLGCACLSLGRFSAAADALRRALLLRPDDPHASHALGQACIGLGDYAGAGRALLLAARHPQLAADSWFRLGIMLGRGRNWPAAAAAMLRATRLDPNHAEALTGLAECAQQLLRQGQSAPPQARGAEAAGMLSFVVCSITPEKITRLRGRLEALLVGQAWELVVIDDARSLCEGYNRGIAASRGELLVLCHDDILLLADDFISRLRAGLTRFELLGIAGATHASGPAWGWSGPPHTHCWIAHRDATGNGLMLLQGSHGAVIGGAQLLDGVFLAGHRRVFEQVGFDAATFDGFHFYDLDFSYRAALAGVRCGICLDLGVLHESKGSYSSAYWNFAPKFTGKFPALNGAPLANQRLGQFRLGSDAELVPIQDWLAHWTTLPDEVLEQRVRAAVSGQG